MGLCMAIHLDEFGLAQCRDFLAGCNLAAVDDIMVTVGEVKKRGAVIDIKTILS